MATRKRIAQNLKRIWNNKQKELAFTQVSAAKQLGWTQGAISHYLNDITEIGAPAIIKLANFLGVSATDIDPDITSELPDVKTLELRYHLSDSTKRIKNKLLHFKISKESFIIYCDKEQEIYDVHGASIAGGSYCEVEDMAGSAKHGPADLVLVKISGKKGFQFSMSDFLPPGKVTKMYRCIAIGLPILGDLVSDDLTAKYRRGDRDTYLKFAKTKKPK